MKDEGRMLKGEGLRLKGVLRTDKWTDRWTFVIAELLLRRKKCQVKVVQKGFATTTVKFATIKVKRQKSFFTLCHILYHCAVSSKYYLDYYLI